MALVKNQVPITFGQGIDTKTDKKSTVPGKLLELENGVFTKLGAISKRNGYDILGKRIIGSSTDITTGQALSNFKDELVLYTGSNMYSYSTANDSWALKDRVVSLLTSSRRIVRNSAEQSVPSVATNQGITVYAWEDTRGGIRVSVLDQETGNYLVSDEQVTASGITPKCVALGRSIYVFFIDSTTIKYRKINCSEPSTIATEAEFASGVDGTNKHYDVITVDSRIFVAWNNDDGASAISIQYITSSGVQSQEVELATQDAQTCITLASDDSNNIWIAWHNGTAVKAAIKDYSLETSVLAPTTVSTISSVRNVTLEVLGTTATIFYEISASDSYNHRISKNTLTLTGTAGTPAQFVRSLGLASKAFVYNSIIYVVAAHESDLQSTYFLMNSDGDVVAKVSQNIGGGLTAKSILPEVIEYSTGNFIFVSQIKGKLNAEDGFIFTRLGINSSIFDFTSNNRFQSAELGDNLHIAGGILQGYDGASVTEHGFNLFPENITATPATSGGSMADGSYLYSVIYEWTDNYGQVHRSAPSVQTVTVSGGSGSGKVTLTIPTLRVTRKADVNVVVYRSEKNLTDVQYRLNSISSPLANSISADSVSYVDMANDTTIIGNEILYTTGGVLENIAPPSCSLVAQFNNRLVIAGLEDENAFWLSKERREDEPVNFSDFIVKRVESRGGGIGAFGVLDGKLIIFKKLNAIYAVAGNGPTDAGTDDDLTEPQAIPTDVGCDNPNSVVITPAGLMFKSAKGIYQLDRSLQTTYIGAPVEDFNDLTISAASLVPNTNQVRFTTTAGVALVYDYLFNQWSTFTNHAGEDNVVWDNRFVFLKSNGDVYKENPDSFTDGSLAIKMRLVTSWLSLVGLQGFQRVYRLLLLGDYKSLHKLIVKIGYNFNEYFTQEVTIDTGALLETATYGEDALYGDGEVYGGEFRLYQFRVHLTQQKCQSIRFSIEDFQASNYGEGFSISGFGLEVGAKQGLFKKESTRSFGTEG